MLAVLLVACQELSGRAPRDAVADVPADPGDRPRDGATRDIAEEGADAANAAAFDAAPCTAPTLAVPGHLRRQAVKDGMRPLRLAGAMKVAEGSTTLEEVLRSTPSLDA